MKKFLGLFLSVALISSAGSFVVACKDPSQPVVIDDAIDLQKYFKGTLNNRIELSDQFSDIKLDAKAFDDDGTGVYEVLDEILNSSHVVNTKFIRDLREFYKKADDKGDYDLSYDMVSTGYEKDHKFGADSLISHHGIDTTGKSIADAFYTYVSPDGGVKTKTDIGSLNGDLGQIAFEGDTPTADEVLKAFNKANKKDNINVTKNDVDVAALTKSITESDATITITKSSNYKGTKKVSFEKKAKIDISDVINTKELGEIKDNNDNTILAKINEKNTSAKLTASDIKISDKSETGATITGQGDYTGTVDVTFTIAPAPVEKKKITDDIKEPDIGTIEDENPETIIAATKKANPDLVTSEVSAKSTNDGHATITVNEGSEVYEQGTTSVNYKIAQKDLKDLITGEGTELGLLDNNNDDTIVTAVNSKNNLDLALNTDVEIDPESKTDSSATLKGIGNYTGEVNLTFSTTPPDDRVNLDTVVTVTDLGELDDNVDATIMAAVKAKNDALEESEVSITDITDTTATVAVNSNSTLYEPGNDVDVTFTVKEAPVPVALEDAIGTKELGELEAIDKDTILAKIKELNADIDETQIEIKEDPTDTEAIVSAVDDSTVYSGQATVTYTYTPVIPAEDLSKLVVKTDLGELTDKEDDTILAGITAANTDVTIDKNEVSIKTTMDGYNGTSVISANEGSTVYTGSATVTFTLPDERVDISTIIKETDFKDLTDATEETILSAIKAANDSAADLVLGTDITIDSIDEEAGTATVNVPSESIKYKGSVPITFSVKVPDIDIATLYTNPGLGLLDDAEPQTVLDKLNTLNSQTLKMDTDVKVEVNKTDVINYTATITAVEGSGYTGKLENLEFTIPDPRANLGSLKSDIGEIPNGEEADIITAFNEVNKDKLTNGELSADDIKVSDININAYQGSATITAVNGSEKCKGSTQVTFTLPDTRTDISTLTGNLTNTIAEETPEAILAEFSSENSLEPALTTTDADVSVTTPGNATITAKPDSTKFKGTVNVIYTVTPPAPNYLLRDENPPVSPIYSFNEYTMAVVIHNVDWHYGTDSKNNIYIPFTIAYVEE